MRLGTVVRARSVGRSRVLAALLTVSVWAIACGERAPSTAPGLQLTGALPVALRWPDTPIANAVFGADIDTVTVEVVRDNESVAVADTVPFPAKDEGLRLALDVPLTQKVETLYVYVQLMAGRSVRYYASSQVILRAAVIPALPPMDLVYIGPGADATAVSLSPRGGFLQPGGTLQFTASAVNAIGPVTVPIGWSVSDPLVATISPTGLLTARSRTGTVRVRAFTPTGVADSVTVTVATTLPQ